MNKGLIHIICGDGKGKTSAAVGLGVRAAGRGRRVHMLCLSKSGGSGETLFLKDAANFKITTVRENLRFLKDMTKKEIELVSLDNDAALKARFALAAEGAIDVLILDEIMFCLSGLVDKSLVLDFIKNKPYGLELVLTGRNPPESLSAAADYISEIKSVRHPFDGGTSAREGIEF
jgi:cob(I)alamin adenosyltransferase